VIVLFTDFGADDIYVAQMKAVLLERAPPRTAIVDLLHSAPRFNPRASAHLLRALCGRFPTGTIFAAVVDPGVGTDRDAAIVRADGRWFVGPDNGLLSVVAARAERVQTWRIVWRPQRLSTSFHGRDLFAPAAAWIAAGELFDDRVVPTPRLNVDFGGGDLAEILYVDHYGNALTGLAAGAVSPAAALTVHGKRVPAARIFAEAPSGSAFWYENSVALVEIAANGASAATMLGLAVGDRVDVVDTRAQ
jgi:S-adenosyl-L-methionine hydrolase (adenosine-forming)